ncbi:hypothetical protein [Thermococcus sp. Bubb.Bath]|uniref:hypothetical protein n=1 Tax=Thermococcus sp. Bubb.Bath TaxID=1638242 RepID=UPI00143A9E9A|nr:hypothetical protein [Thermococcus sp. Bubb.Bath]NJF25363.1 hypothetical protein [Thermococcus sp. Bubb.Bath]
MTESELREELDELRKEISKLRKEIADLKGGAEWADDQFENHEARIRTIEKILDVTYDEEAGQYKSKYLNKLYGMIKGLERRIGTHKRGK